MSVKILAKNDESLKSVLKGTALFTDLSEEEIQSCLVCSKAESIIYEKGEMIFSEEDYPVSLPVLISGSVTLGMDFYDGKRKIIAIFEWISTTGKEKSSLSLRTRVMFSVMSLSL